ncbi:MAG: Xaa-Pro peptidase family protein [Smithella sp.]
MIQQIKQVIPALELQKRLDRFQEVLRSKNIDGALLVHRVDTMYFTGTAQDLHVYIPNTGKPLILAYRYLERARKECPWEIIPLTGISKLTQLIGATGHPVPKILGLEYDVLPVARFELYRKAFAETKFIDISYALRFVRAVKSEWEIAQIEKACDIYSKLLEYVSTILRPGMTEVELESLLGIRSRLLGQEPIVRLRSFCGEIHFGGVTAGARAAVSTNFDGPTGGLGPSWAYPIGPSHSPIQINEPIVMDFALAFNGYLADVTRMLVIGELSEKFQRAYEISLVIEERIRRALIPGRTAGEVYDETLAWVQKETPFAENFMGFGPTQVRFVGHGIGLELDELPIICRGAREVLQPGMVIAIEPKFFFPGEGVVGVEDDVVIEGEKGARYISSSSREVVKITP